MNTWILVGDASRARLFSANGAKGPWTLVRSLEHPESRMNDADLAGRQRGRQQQSGGVGRPAMEPVTMPKEVEREAFAAELGHLLDHEFDVNSYSDLVLIAPPHFLGLLRKTLGGKLRKHVIAELDKDYSQLPLHDLQPRVEQWLKDQNQASAAHTGK
ncbi:MAG TPA: host attachment protein [Pirellulales bacterium]|jgi:protein required for attachment to host cells|nr:host attachment protein [Pirellulales bacterium]